MDYHPHKRIIVTGLIVGFLHPFRQMQYLPGSDILTLDNDFLAMATYTTYIPAIFGARPCTALNPIIIQSLS